MLKNNWNHKSTWPRNKRVKISARRVRDRIKAVLLYDEGRSPKEIARILLISDEAVRHHVDEYKSSKNLFKIFLINNLSRYVLAIKTTTEPTENTERGLHLHSTDTFY